MRRNGILNLLAITVVFGLTAQGAMAQQAPAGKQGKPGQQGRRGGMNLKALTERLKLTEAQQTKLKPIMEESTKKRKALQDDTKLSEEDKRKKMLELRKETTTKIEAVLTDEQKKQLKEMQAKGRQQATGQSGTKPKP
jgi:Spy/CpxP family protein refolding chaperone